MIVGGGVMIREVRQESVQLLGGVLTFCVIGSNVRHKQHWPSPHIALSGRLDTPFEDLDLQMVEKPD